MLTPFAAGLCAPPVIARASVSSFGMEGNASSYSPAISASGRYVAFDSDASNLVINDGNAVSDVFVHDRRSGSTRRVSLRSDGAEAEGGFYGEDEVFLGSYNPSFSGNGRLVAFESIAANLVEEDDNGSFDVFVHNLRTGVTERVSVNGFGIGGDSDSFNPSLSYNGRIVAFNSFASNLVHDDGNDADDVFVRDRKTGELRRVSLNSNGEEGNDTSFFPDLSANGRYVTFMSYASNLDVADNNGARDVFVHDRKTGLTTRISVNSFGVEGNGDCYIPHISANGRFVVFASDASNLVSDDDNGATDIFVYDRKTGEIKRASVDSSGVEGNFDSFGPSISANGRLVTFSSDADNLVVEDGNGVADVFVHDMKRGVTKRLTVNKQGFEGDRDSYEPVTSSNGRAVAFSSDADNLVDGDNNEGRDIFVLRRR